MAKTLSPVCKLCRREGEKLFLKGERCFTPKCSFEKRDFAPGQHGRTAGRGGGKGKGMGTGRASDFARQLRAKQKARRIYGVMERQFRRYYDTAKTGHSLTGLTLLQKIVKSFVCSCWPTFSRKLPFWIFLSTSKWIDTTNIRISSWNILFQ